MLEFWYTVNREYRVNTDTNSVLYRNINVYAITDQSSKSLTYIYYMSINET